MYELGTGHAPFLKYQKSNDSLFEAIAAARRKDIEIDGEDAEFNDLLMKCMTKSAGERISMKDVLRHEYLRGAEGLKDKWIADFKVYEKFSQIKKRS